VAVAAGAGPAASGRPGGAGGLCHEQGAALGHEAGHGAVSRQRWVNALTGFAFMSFGSGSSQASWQDMHEGHHTPRQHRRRPQPAFALLSFTEADARAATGVRRLCTRHQPLLFWPMVSLMGVAFRLGSLQHMRVKPRETRIEQVLVLLHHLLWLVLPMALTGWALALANYLLVLWFCGVYLASIFVTNHLGAPTMVADGSFMARQAGNARNLKDSWLARRYFVGLNSHIEHHLFHRISFTKLHRARAATAGPARRKASPITRWVSSRHWWRSSSSTGAWPQLRARHRHGVSICHCGSPSRKTGLIRLGFSSAAGGCRDNRLRCRERTGAPPSSDICFSNLPPSASASSYLGAPQVSGDSSQWP